MGDCYGRVAVAANSIILEIRLVNVPSQGRKGIFGSGRESGEHHSHSRSRIMGDDGNTQLEHT